MPALFRTRTALLWLRPASWRQRLSCWMSGRSSFRAMSAGPSWQRGAGPAKAESMARLDFSFCGRPEAELDKHLAQGGAVDGGVALQAHGQNVARLQGYNQGSAVAEK